MATKNWKKTSGSSTNRIVYVKKDFLKSLQIIKNSDSGYRVFIEELGFVGKRTDFKTKQKAMKFAEAYMRKH